VKWTEYGAQHAECILLLHGGGLSWWNHQETAQLLGRQYRVVLPVLDGHAGSGAPFTTLAQNAQEILSWIDENCGGQVLLIGGVSLGAQLVVELLARRPGVCRYAVIESALVFPMRLTHAMIKPAYMLCYPLIRQRWFARLQARALYIPPALFEAYYRDTAGIARSDMIAFLEANANYRLQECLRGCQARCLVLAGGRELPIIKRSAKRLAQLLPNARLLVLPGCVHGEISLAHPEQYTELLLSLMEA
jgi:pimeloyl-ACP methyl ester carboxylesterase